MFRINTFTFVFFFALALVDARTMLNHWWVEVMLDPCGTVLSLCQVGSSPDGGLRDSLKNVPWECCVLEEAIGMTTNTFFYLTFLFLSEACKAFWECRCSGSSHPSVLCLNLSFLRDFWGNPDCEETLFFPLLLLFWYFDLPWTLSLLFFLCFWPLCLCTVWLINPIVCDQPTPGVMGK